MTAPPNTTRLRFLSLLSLLLLAILFGLGITLVLSNPGLLLLYAVCGAALLLGAWLLLTRPARQRVWGAAVTGLAVIGLLVVTWTFLGQPENRQRVVLLVVVAVIYGLLAGTVARMYWRGQRTRAGTGAGEFKHPALVINPKSGGGRATKAHVAETASKRGITVTVLEPGQSMVTLAKTVAESGVDVLGVSGGDGSLGAVAAVAMEHQLPLVVLPGGTRCHFARDIGLDPKYITDALEGFWGVERLVDVGLINGRVFLNNASFGLYADIISRPEYRDHKAAVSRQVLQDLASSDKPYYPLRFRDNHDHEHSRAAQVLVGVNRYETLKLDELGERSQLDGGMLHVIMIQTLDDKTATRLASMALPLGGRKPGADGITQWTAPNFTIADPSGKVMAGVDGESVEFESPVTVQILPKALRLFVPAEGARSRPIKRFSLKAAKALGSLAAKR